MKKIFKIGLFSMCALVTCSAISSTLAWFIAKDRIDTTSRIGGEVLSGYFHSGDGSSANPFTITTPLHYENMIRLHNEFDGFAEEGFNFQFGSKDLNLATNPETPKFYEVNSDGTINYNASSDVLNLRGQTFTPLGTEEKPFVGKIDGSNLTISNFNIDGEGFNDVGIFGFVDNEPGKQGGDVSIHNCYFKDFTINAAKASKDYYKHTSFPHDEDAAVGYLAGHVVDSSSFTNCYVNDCEITGAPSSDALNTYSYYGRSEYDSLGGEIGKGSNYEFKFNSHAIYSYLQDHYNEISDSPMRFRDTEYAGETITNDFSNGGLTTVNPISNAITRNNNNYTLQGTTPQTTAARNYSISTLGYQPLDPSTNSTQYDVFYKNGDKFVSIAEPDEANKVSGQPYISFYGPNDAGYANSSYEARKLIETTNQSFGTFNQTTNQWEYFRMDNEMKQDTIPVKLTFTISGTLSFNEPASFNTPKIEEKFVKLFINGSEATYSESNPAPTAPSPRVNVSWSTTHQYIFDTTYTYSYIANVKMGTNYCGFCFAFNTSNNSNGNEVGISSGTSSFNRTSNLMETGQTSFVVTQQQYDNYKNDNSNIPSYTFACTNITHDTKNQDRAGVMTGITCNESRSNEPIPYLNYSNIIEPKPIYLKRLDKIDSTNPSDYKLLDDNTARFAYQDYQTGSHEENVLDGDGNQLYKDESGRTVKLINGNYYAVGDDGSYLDVDGGGNPIAIDPSKVSEMKQTVNEYSKKWIATVSPRKQYLTVGYVEVDSFDDLEVGSTYHIKVPSGTSISTGTSAIKFSSQSNIVTSISTSSSQYYTKGVFGYVRNSRTSSSSIAFGFSTSNNNNVYNLSNASSSFEADIVYNGIDGNESDLAGLLDYIYIDRTEEKVPQKYIADDDDPTNELTMNGYNSENIDIVGGGVTFTNVNFGKIDSGVVAIESERTGILGVGRRICTYDATQCIGQTFYATKYCPASIVLYLKNYANPNDGRDSKLGDIKFSYINLSYDGESRLDLTRPVFKKGATSNNQIVSLNLVDFGSGKQSDNPNIDYVLDVPCEIHESEAQKCSYCALDANKKIICTFDQNGNAEFASSVRTQAQKEEILNQIDTYVIVIGSQGSGSCYVTNIDFSYKAANGAGGTFGSVGYRSATETLENTILNFYYVVPAGHSLTIKVSYSNSMYTVTASYSGGNSGDQIQIFVYNYEPDVYAVNFNGTNYTSGEFVITLTSPGSP